MSEAKLACTASGMDFEAWRCRPAYRVHCATTLIANLLCGNCELGNFRCLRAYRDADANALRKKVAQYVRFVRNQRRGIDQKVASMKLTFIIDLDERGLIKGHVERPNGESIFEFSNENENGWPDEDGLWLVNDGYMKHGRDARGLLEYLQSIGVAHARDSMVLRG